MGSDLHDLLQNTVKHASAVCHHCKNVPAMCNTRVCLGVFEIFCLVISYNIFMVTVYPYSHRFSCPFIVGNLFSILSGDELSPDEAQSACSEMRHKEQLRRHLWLRLFITDTPTVDQEPTTCVYHLRSHNITCGGGRSTSGDSGITCDTDVTRGWYNLTPGVYRYREYNNNSV